MTDANKCGSSHKQHMCQRVARKEAMDQLKPLVKNAKFICRGCGRVANEAKWLCDPEGL